MSIANELPRVGIFYRFHAQQLKVLLSGLPRQWQAPSQHLLFGLNQLAVHLNYLVIYQARHVQQISLVDPDVLADLF